MVTNMITRLVPLTDTALGLVPLTDTALGITRTCTIGIVSPFTDAAISAASPIKHHRGVDLISAVLPFGRLWYGQPNAISNAIGYAMHSSRSRDAVIRVYDAAGNVAETHEHKGDFRDS
jgi:hypothetical protein